jgi:CheY-like chemotaxis protein
LDKGIAPAASLRHSHCLRNAKRLSSRARSFRTHLAPLQQIACGISFADVRYRTSPSGKALHFWAVMAVFKRPVWIFMDRALRVVVVDDNYDANFALSRLLEWSGYEVVGRAYDGVSGLNVVKSANPDVAILDIAMPALDGFALCRRILSEVVSPPKLVALSGMDVGPEAADSGFDAYFCKPANWSKLNSLLAQYRNS